MEIETGMPALSRKEAGEAMRATLLRCAAQILTQEGVSGLTARHLSCAANASTKVIYSHFGGMQGVVAALYESGFSLLAQQLSAARSSAKPQNSIADIAFTYRAFALSNADLFDLMYGPKVDVLLPSRDARIDAKPALDVVISAFFEIGAPDAADSARAFWAAMHGVVALERAGWFDGEEALRRLVAVITSHQ
jgi:AcrR family transcriptional regulator